MKIKNLLKNIDEVVNTEIDFQRLEDAKKFTSDKHYFTLIAEGSNGGYFFNNSLHLYGYCDTPKYHSSHHINKILQEEYKDIIGNLFCFGQDVFGNQFGFEQERVFIFNIETGEKEEIAKDFKSWLNVLSDDLEYLTGKDFVEVENQHRLKGSRYCPKKPFVIGGVYELNNFYLESFPGYLKINANIARQVYNLPEGTQIKIKTTE